MLLRLCMRSIELLISTQPNVSVLAANIHDFAASTTVGTSGMRQSLSTAVSALDRFVLAHLG